jgi:hypothetical protein
VNKLTLIIVECLFHNYSTSHFRLMFYVLCRDIQPGHFQFIPFYVLKDFFPNPLMCKYLSKYVRPLFNTWSHYPLPNPLGAKDHMTMVFLTLLTMRQQIFRSIVSFAIYVFFEFVIRFYLMLFGVFFWNLFSLYYYSI